MKIKYLGETTNGKVIHLFDFSNDEVMEIKTLIDEMAEGKINRIAMHEHALVNARDNDHLTLRLGHENQGILYNNQNKEFTCALTKVGYENMSELILSFAEHSLEMEGFEWLDETGDVSLLISPSKRWE